MFLKIVVIFSLQWSLLKAQVGPDPWNNANIDTADIKHNEHDVPPDIRMALNRKIVSEIKEPTGICEWSFMRMLAIILKSGQVQEDGNTVVSLQLKFDDSHWQILNDYVKSGTPIKEDVFRRTLGYVEEAIYKPSISEKIIMAWTDYVQIYISEYKVHLIWIFGTLSASLLAVWLWKHMSPKHIFIIIFVLLYCYEIFISYKEAEEKEYQKFVNALNSCQWYFWSSTCDIPAPDVVTFLKHMNPSKIGMRMFTSIISEPMVTFSAVIKPMIHDITDGLWWPFDKIAYGTITVFINLFIIVLFIFIVCNFIFNISIDLYLACIGVRLRQRNRTIFSPNESSESRISVTQEPNNSNISNSTLEKILDVCSKALTIQNNVKDKPQQNLETATRTLNSQFNMGSTSAIKRSASTGRLPNMYTFENNNQVTLVNNVRHRKNVAYDYGGAGDVL